MGFFSCFFLFVCLSVWGFLVDWLGFVCLCGLGFFVVVCLGVFYFLF